MVYKKTRYNKAKQDTRIRFLALNWSENERIFLETEYKYLQGSVTFFNLTGLQMQLNLGPHFML